MVGVIRIACGRDVRVLRGGAFRTARGPADGLWASPLRKGCRTEPPQARTKARYRGALIEGEDVIPAMFGDLQERSVGLLGHPTDVALI